MYRIDSFARVVIEYLRRAESYSSVTNVGSVALSFRKYKHDSFFDSFSVIQKISFCHRLFWYPTARFKRDETERITEDRE